MNRKTCQNLAIVAAAGMAAPAMAQPDIRISEVFYNPAGAEAETEWVEIYNAGTQALDISQWVLADEDNNSPSDPFGSGAFYDPNTDTISPEADPGLNGNPFGTVINSVVIEPGEAIVLMGFWDARTENPDDTDNTIERFIASWGEDTDADEVGDVFHAKIVCLVNTITIANTASLTNEVLEMQDGNGNTVDFQNYQVGRDENDWPFSANGRSIYVQPNFIGGFGSFSFDEVNEIGTAFAVAVAGVDAAYEGRLVESDDNGDTNFSTLYQEGDVASPGIVDLNVAGSFVDADGNARDDAVDIFLGAADCNRDRVNDAGEPDCDGNGIPDSCDGFLTENDCDRDGQPDSCQIAMMPSLDSNDNGILDTCEGIYGEVIITEIMFNPSGTEREWIELYNAGSTTIDMENFFFQDFDAPVADGPESLFPAFSLAPGEIAVIGDPTLEQWEAGWGPVSGYQYISVGGSISLANNADLVNENRTLLKATEVMEGGTIVTAVVSDNANYSGTTSNAVVQNGWPGDDGRGSFYLRGEGNFNLVDNNDGGNWALSIEFLDGARRVNDTGFFDGRDIGSPGVINLATPERPVGDVIISEIHFATNSDFPGEPGIDGPGGIDEFVEIYNTTGGAIDISGWRLADEDGETTPFPPGTTLQAGEAAIVYGGGDFTELVSLPINAFNDAWQCGYKVISVNNWYLDIAGDGLDRLGDSGEAGTASDPSAAREILRIIDDEMQVQDIVNYDDDGFVWPIVANGNPLQTAFSIYIFNPADLNEEDNDNGLNWATSLVGFDDARENFDTTIFNATNFASPGAIDGIQSPDLGACDQPCSKADLSQPFGALDFSDVVGFLSAFGSGLPAGDLAEPFGALDFSDVIEFLTLFGAGCP